MPVRRIQITRKRKIQKQTGGSAQPGPNIYVFYHIYCNKKTEDVVKDQAFRIVFSGLYRRATAIKCFLAGQPDMIPKVGELLKNIGKKFEITKEGPNDTSYERFTLLDIPKHIQDHDKFLYIHSKGVSEIGRFSGKAPEYENIFWWRTWMEYYLIGQFERCLEELNHHDIVGVNYSNKLIGSHFSGNFWWSTGKYYKSLSGQIGSQYYEPEKYIFSGNPKYKDIDHGRIPENQGLYSSPFYSSNYID
uniref:Uncharacterized protein n=1 Tax=viral metagenome TaxID=1070528 RepID=A0A6C0JW21_9ZZZZ